MTIDDAGFVTFDPYEWGERVERWLAEGHSVRVTATGPFEHVSLLPTAPRWVLFETVKIGLQAAYAESADHDFGERRS